MIYKVQFTHRSEKDLQKMPPLIIKRILNLLSDTDIQTNPFKKAINLKNVSPDTYRFRVGDYRIVFRVDEQTKEIAILLVIRIAHRKEIYKNF